MAQICGLRSTSAFRSILCALLAATACSSGSGSPPTSTGGYLQGGNQALGGTVSAGGAAGDEGGAGGNAPSGGNGGEVGSGGRATGGTSAGSSTSNASGGGSGGTTATGGAFGSGGKAASGGTVSVGGSLGAGGVTPAGGSPASGGSTVTGGSAGACVPSVPSGTAYYASPTGSGSTCSTGSPCSLGTALGKVAGGVTVYLRGGTYNGSGYLAISGSGTAASWAVLSAYPCELPIVDLGDSSSIGISGTYISIRGVAAIHGSAGFGNKWTGGGTTNSNGNLELINCIADMNSANGIAFRSAKGVHIKQCIASHTGWSTTQSWSSGFDIFGAQGTFQDNIVEQSIAFENVDMQHHSDGSGFIVDDIGTGTTFVNNLGFRNGGSCIRLTTSTGTHLINNSCYNNGLDPGAGSDPTYSQPKTPDEIFFSSSDTTKGAVMYNNLVVATGQGGDAQAIFGSGGATLGNNLTNNTNTVDFWADANGTNPDFHLKPTATNAIGKGTTTEAPSEDIGFDPKCIAKKAPTGTGVQSWWLYSIDFDYIKSIGGIAQCFHPEARTGTPDIGAYAL